MSTEIKSVSGLDLVTQVQKNREQEIRAKFDKILAEVPSKHFYSVDNLRKLLSKYNAGDLELIYQDFVDLLEKTFKGVDKRLDYVVTAGGPAAGKSTLLESLLGKEGDCPDSIWDKGMTRAYIDPDKTCLLQMKNTYLADLSNCNRNADEAYAHWREASNFLANAYLAIGLSQGYAIAHGSTMATPYAKNALEAIRGGYNYKTTVLHVTCEEEVRQRAEQQRRDKGIVQCTNQDFKDKQQMFLSLLPDYLTSSDKVIFFYRTDEGIKWAAKVEGKQLTVYDKKSLSQIQEIHDGVQGKEFWEKHFPKQ